MQNKGLVICVAVLLTLASIFYLSFSVATSYYDSQAEKIKDPIARQDYKDSVKYLGIYSYQKCLETQIGLGLDLKGGMNVILEISVPDVVDVLADHKTDPAYVKSLQQAKKEEETSQRDFISLFIDAYHKNAPGHRLAEIFATQQLKGKVSTQSTDEQVESALRAEVTAAIDNILQRGPQPYRPVWRRATQHPEARGTGRPTDGRDAGYPRAGAYAQAATG